VGCAEACISIRSTSRRHRPYYLLRISLSEKGVLLRRAAVDGLARAPHPRASPGRPASRGSSRSRPAYIAIISKSLSLLNSRDRLTTQQKVFEYVFRKLRAHFKRVVPNDSLTKSYTFKAKQKSIFRLFFFDILLGGGGVFLSFGLWSVDFRVNHILDNAGTITRLSSVNYPSNVIY